MKKKHALTTIIVVLILAVLVYLQFHSWKNFDWKQFFAYTGGVSLWRIGAAVGLIYGAYVLRAIRWALFLRPTQPTDFRRLIAPQVIGFAALGLFGRAGEFARPLLIARKEKLTFASQLAVWTVERFFDMGAVLALMIAFLVLKGGKLAQILVLALHSGLHAAAKNAGHKLPLAIIGAAVLAIVFVVLKRVSAKAAAALRSRLQAFREGFNTIHDAKSFVQIVVVSLAMWLMIASAYLGVLHAYPQIPVVNAAGEQHIARMSTMKLDDVLLVMGSSMLGSVVQLPGGVGGSQLAVIGVLQSNIFNNEPYNITRELAVSCGIMLWLVTFMSVIPAGLLMAKFERVSFRAVENESEAAEEEVEQFEHS